MILVHYVKWNCFVMYVIYLCNLWKKKHETVVFCPGAHFPKQIELNQNVNMDMCLLNYLM